MRREARASNRHFVRGRILARTFLVLAFGAATVAAAPPSGDCRDYTVSGVALGMSPKEVRKAIGIKSTSRAAATGRPVPRVIETYRAGQRTVEVEYRGSLDSLSSASVVAVRGVEPLHSSSVGRSLRQRYGDPSDGGDRLDDALQGGPATWVDAGCGVVVVASRRQAEWWEPHEGTLEIEIREAGPEERVSTPEAVPAAASLERDEDPVAPGPGVSRPVRIPESYVAPVYPEAARRSGARGRVRLEATILSDGSVGEVRVLESSGTRYGFDDAAVEAVRQWRYTPARRDGDPVAATIELVIEFN